jgi:hypothetical protein
MVSSIGATRFCVAVCVGFDFPFAPLIRSLNASLLTRRGTACVKSKLTNCARN